MRFLITGWFLFGLKQCHDKSNDDDDEPIPLKFPFQNAWLICIRFFYKNIRL